MSKPIEDLTIMEAYAIQKNLGDYRRVVRLARKHRKRHPAIADLAEILDISAHDCQVLLTTIDAHPEWDDAKVAEEINWED